MTRVQDLPWPTPAAAAMLVSAVPEVSSWGALRVAFLAGHASNRRYFRVHGDGGTFVLMQLAGDALASEELTHEAPSELSQLDVGRFLVERGLPVPRALAADLDEGLVALEDLGDTMLESLVAHADTEVRRPWYERAVELILRVQAAGQGAAAPDCIALRRRFDAGLLRAELDHFREWGLEAATGATLRAGQRAALDAAFDDLAARLAALPVALAHRDFQSRNLMVSGDTLWMIDVQDALLAPVVYDLVALLRDSYVELTTEEVESLLGVFLDGRRGHGLPPLSPATAAEAFRLQTLQRKLKDAGRFVYIDRVKHNPSFLQHIPASLRYVRAALAEHSEYGVIADLLDEHHPERAAAKGAP